VAAEPDQVRQYLLETLGVTVSPSRWPAERRLPLFLRRQYSFYGTEILDLPCLLMVDRGETYPAAASIRKHVDHVRSKWAGEIVYVRGQVVAYQRKRLIEQKVPFIVPGNQMYLPMLGIDLREHFRGARRVSPALSPATPVVVLHALLRNGERTYRLAELAEQLGYSKMTMTRAFNELDAVGLAHVSVRNRQRHLALKGARQGLWQEALPLLRSPVKQRRHIRSRAEEQIGLVAGLSALARYSMLAAPAIPTVAISRDLWKTLRRGDGFTETVADDPESKEVEVWTYDPGLLGQGQLVDRLSLFLSLKDTEDERVQAAMEEMMEEAP
jgi:DNA-binding MarR family transcriptional regulator